MDRERITQHSGLVTDILVVLAIVIIIILTPMLWLWWRIRG